MAEGKLGKSQGGTKRFVGFYELKSLPARLAAVDQKIKALFALGHKYCCCCCCCCIRSVTFNAKRAETMCEPAIKR